VAGFEALIRWRHPERGLLLPASFLDVAEQMGIMGAIDEWVLYEACRQARAWGFGNAWRGSLTMSVNLSSKAFGLSSLVDLVGGAIASSGIAPDTLRLELTESVAVADPARTAAILRELRALGVGISLDDFGTGFCSLAYLQQLPVDSVKVDRSFVARLEDAGDPIAPWIVELARALRLTVVAEGPETPDQLARLESIGCDYAQGFALAHPMSADDVGAALAQPGWSNGRMRLPETTPAFRTR
jgi:Amt family ammonium transporter